MKYPSDGQGDFVNFSHMPYSAKGQGGGGGGGITLYMPNDSVPVSSAQSWQEKSFQGPLGQLKKNAAFAAAEAINTVGTGKLDTGAIVSKFNKRVQEEGGYGEAARQGALGIAGRLGGVGSASNILALTQGEVYNPNSELIYQNPNFRSFVFDYTFIPKNEGEAQSVCQIIKEFKTWSSPALAQKGRLKIPDIWKVSYSNQYFNKFKQAALTNITVHFNSGLSQHATFSSGMPVVTSMQLQFTEVEFVFRKDHQEGLTGY